MKKKISVLLCAALTASLLGGCGGKTVTETPASSESQTAGENSAEKPSTEEGKVITYAIQSEPETLDPSLNNYTMSSIVLQNMFMGLYQFGPDGKLTDGCAESYEMSEDGLVYTFKLKPGLKWSDGLAVTAHDFEYAWKRVLNPEVASPASWDMYCLKNGEAYNTESASADEVGVKALDDTTLEVTLENPTAYFLYLTASADYFPLRKDVVEGAETWTKSADTYVCNGAFRLKEINPQASYVLEKNPEYAYADTVKLDGLKIVFIGTAEAALSAFNSGEVDVVDNILINSQGQSQYSGSEELKVYDTIGTNYYDFNCSHEAMSDPRVRRALAMSITRDTINQSVVASKPKAAYAFVPPGIPYGDSDKDFRTTNGDLIKEDPAAAKQLLADAGYPDGSGFPTLTFITQNDQEKKDIAQVMQAMWKENLGINVEIITYESKVYWDEHAAGNFDIAFDGWTGSYPDPNTNLNCFVKARTADESRWSGDLADQYDAMLAECASLADNNKRMEIFTEAEKILMDEMPIMPLSFKNSQMLVNKRCNGVVKTYLGHTLFKYADVE